MPLKLNYGASELTVQSSTKKWVDQGDSTYAWVEQYDLGSNRWKCYVWPAKPCYTSHLQHYGLPARSDPAAVAGAWIDEALRRDLGPTSDQTVATAPLPYPGDPAVLESSSASPSSTSGGGAI